MRREKPICNAGALKLAPTINRGKRDQRVIESKPELPSTCAITGKSYCLLCMDNERAPLQPGDSCL